MAQSLSAFSSAVRSAPGLPPLRWYFPNFGGKLRVLIAIDGPVNCLRARRLLADEISVLPVLGWSNRSRTKAAAAVGADVLQNLVDTLGAERTFETTDPSIRRVDGQCLVAVLAGWSQFQHLDSPCPANEAVEKPSRATSASPSSLHCQTFKWKRGGLQILENARSLASPHGVRDGGVQGHGLVSPDSQELAVVKAEFDSVEARDIPQPTSRNEA